MYSQKQGYYKGTEIVKWFKEYNNGYLVIHQEFYKNDLVKSVKEYENNILISYSRFNKFGKILYLKEYVKDGKGYKYSTYTHRYYKKYFTVKHFLDDKLLDYLALDLITERSIYNFRKPKNILKQIYNNTNFNYNAMVGYEIYNDLVQEYIIINHPDMLGDNKAKSHMLLLFCYFIPRYFSKIEKDMPYNKIVKDTKSLIKDVFNDFKLVLAESIDDNQFRDLVLNYLNKNEYE
jgi:hypothetical protein